MRDFFLGIEVTGADEVTIRCDRNALTVLFEATRQLGKVSMSEEASPATQIASALQDCLLFQLPQPQGE